MKNTKSLLTISALVALTTACAESDELKVGVVASVHTEDNLTIEFTRLKDGAIVISEIGPIETPSRVAMYAADTPTALEMFRAIAPTEEAPLELEMDHLAVTDAEPRDLSLNFRGFTPHIYATDCTYIADATWYFDTLDGTNWTKWDYWWGTDDSYVHQSFAAQHMITHVCNYDGSEMELIMAGNFDQSNYSLDDIHEGERGIVYLLGSTSYAWIVGAGTVNSSNAEFRHGYMAP